MLKRYLRRHSASLLATVLLSGLSGLATMILLAYTNKLATIGIHDGGSAVLYAGCLLVGLLLTSTVSQVLLAQLGSKLVEQLRTELAQKFLAIDYEKTAGRNHAIFGALMQDLGRIGPLVLVVPQIAYNALLVVLCSAYLVYISTSLYFLFAAFMAAALAASVFVERLTRSQFDAMRSAEEAFFEHLRAISEGKKEFCMNRTRTNHFTDQLLQPTITRARALMTRVHLGWGINDSWSTVVLNCAVFAIVYFGYTVLKLPSATILQFVIGGLFILGPLNFFAQTAQGVGLGLASLRHLERIGIDLDADVRLLPDSRAADTASTRDWNLMQVDSLAYRYTQMPGDDAAFGVGPVSFTIRRGETAFFVGGNGSGKSTLLLLLCGLLTPKQGAIRIDGRPIQEDLDRYREMFCGTFNDGFVFRHVLDSAGAIKSDDEVKALLQKFALDGHVQVDRGELSRLDLSTGQRKRLALIQSFAQDRDIYYFDEWAAEQDPSFREYFYCSVLPELRRKGKTIIVISHDDRYFHLADRVFKLDAGLIASDTSPRTERGHAPSAALHRLGGLSSAAASQILVGAV